MSNYLPVLLVSATTNAIPDDTAVSTLPRGQVDYLSHNWQEEDVWRSWRNMTRQKNEIANGMRLENASWRTWWKQRNKLKTVEPATLNWLKDSDVTWLYGPLHTAVDWTPPPRPYSSPNNSSSTPFSSHSDIPPSYPPSAPLPHKPILKHRSISELLTSDFPPSPLFTPVHTDSEGDNDNDGGMEHQEDLDLIPEADNCIRDFSRPPLMHTKSEPNVVTLESSPSSSLPQSAQHSAPTTAPQDEPNSFFRPTSATDLSNTAYEISVGRGSLQASNYPAKKKQKHISFNTFVEQCIAIEKPKMVFAAGPHGSCGGVLDGYDDGYDEDDEDGYEGVWNGSAIESDSDEEDDPGGTQLIAARVSRFKQPDGIIDEDQAQEQLVDDNNEDYNNDNSDDDDDKADTTIRIGRLPLSSSQLHPSSRSSDNVPPATTSKPRKPPRSKSVSSSTSSSSSSSASTSSNRVSSSSSSSGQSQGNKVVSRRNSAPARRRSFGYVDGALNAFRTNAGRYDEGAEPPSGTEASTITPTSTTTPTTTISSFASGPPSSNLTVSIHTVHMTIAPIAPTLLKTAAGGENDDRDMYGYGCDNDFNGHHSFGDYVDESGYGYAAGDIHEGEGDAWGGLTFVRNGLSSYKATGRPKERQTKDRFGDNASPSSGGEPSGSTTPVELVYVPRVNAAMAGGYGMPRRRSNTGLAGDRLYDTRVDRQESQIGRGESRRRFTVGEDGDAEREGDGIITVTPASPTSSGFSGRFAEDESEKPPTIERGCYAVGEEIERARKDADPYDYFGGPDLGEDFSPRTYTSRRKRGDGTVQDGPTVSGARITRNNSDGDLIASGCERSGPTEESQRGRSRSRSRSRTPSPACIPSSSSTSSDVAPPTSSDIIPNAVSVPRRSHSFDNRPTSPPSTLLSPPMRGRSSLPSSLPANGGETRGRSATRTPSSSFSDREWSRSSHGSPMGSLSPDGSVGLASVGLYGVYANGRIDRERERERERGDREREREMERRSGGVERERGRPRIGRRLSQSLSPDVGGMAPESPKGGTGSTVDASVSVEGNESGTDGASLSGSIISLGASSDASSSSSATIVPSKSFEDSPSTPSLLKEATTATHQSSPTFESLQASPLPSGFLTTNMSRVPVNASDSSASASNTPGFMNMCNGDLNCASSRSIPTERGGHGRGLDVGFGLEDDGGHGTIMGRAVGMVSSAGAYLGLWQGNSGG